MTSIASRRIFRETLVKPVSGDCRRRRYLAEAKQKRKAKRKFDALAHEALSCVQNCRKAVRERDRARHDLRELSARYTESANLAPFYVRVSEIDSFHRSRLYSLSVTFSLDEIAMQLYRGSREGYVDRELRAIVRDVEHKVYRVLADKLREALGVPKGGQQ